MSYGAFRVVPSSTDLFDATTPSVGVYASSKVPETNRRTRDAFPTASSPRRQTLSFKSGSNPRGAAPPPATNTNGTRLMPCGIRRAQRVGAGPQGSAFSARCVVVGSDKGTICGRIRRAVRAGLQRGHEGDFRVPSAWRDGWQSGCERAQRLSSKLAASPHLHPDPDCDSYPKDDDKRHPRSERRLRRRRCGRLVVRTPRCPNNGGGNDGNSRLVEQRIFPPPRSPALKVG